MSVRAVIIAVISAAVIAVGGYVNFHYIHLNQFVGNFLPIIVFFPLVLAVAAVGPLLRAAGARPLERSELAVIFLGMMLACAIPGSTMLRMLSRTCVMPVEMQRARVDWGRTGALGHVPPALMLNAGRYDTAVMDPIVQGAGADLPLGQVPWDLWASPLAAWLPVLALLAVATVCLGLMVHRCWAGHERLAYPVGRLADLLITGEQGRSVLRQRACLAALGAVLALHVVNGLGVWTDNRALQIPLTFDFPQIAEAVPAMQHVPWGQALCHIRIWPAFVALACFATADVSFSLGILPLVWLVAAWWLMHWDVRIEWIATQGGVIPWQTAGSFIALGLMLAYLGRRTYGAMLAAALGLGRRGAGRVSAYEVWACRGLLAAGAGLVAVLTRIGLAWPIAILLVLGILLGYLVIARINVESGLFLIQTPWGPLAVLLGLLGGRALGLDALATAGTLCAVVAMDGRECLMPFVLNGLKVCDTVRLPLGKAGGLGLGIFLLVLAAAAPLTLWADYRQGLVHGEWWTTQAFPTQVPDLLTKTAVSLGVDQAHSSGLSALGRLGTAAPEPRCLAAMLMGAVLVVGLYRLRLRYPWWPLHPVMFLVWGTWAMQEFAYSFLLGWAIKAAAMRLGVTYQRLRSVMVGVLVGDLCGGALWMIVGAGYWMATGKNPPVYHIYPGG